MANKKRSQHRSLAKLAFARLGACLVLALICAQTPAAERETDPREQELLEQFRTDVQPLLARYCLKCHSGKEASAEIRFDKLDPNMATGDDGETWHDALNQLNQGDMPPEDADQPSPAERETLVRWMTSELKRATAIRHSTGGRVVMRRLTRYEYANTMRDLLGVDHDFQQGLPPDPISSDGFQNNGSVLATSPLQVEQYLKTAREAVAKAIVVGERPEVIRFENELIGNEGYGQGSEKQIPSAGMMMFPPPPLEGPFRVLVTASAEKVAGAEPPSLGVHVGYRNSPNNFRVQLAGESVLTGSEDKPQTIEVRGRMENFPHADPNTPVKERRNPGLRIGFGNSYYANYPAGVLLEAPANADSNKGKQSAFERLQRDAQKNTLPGEAGMPRIKIHNVVFEAPFYENWPPDHHTQILFPSELRKKDERQYAREVLQRFMRRAFRRPINKEELDEMMGVYDAYRPHVDSLELAMREVLPEVLVSPHFLFLLEPKDADRPQPLTDHELAARLSYFLWSTAPDASLTTAADAGKLQDDAFLEKQVRSMVADERSWNFVTNFTNQWLKLNELNRIAIHSEVYPDFDERLKRDMQLETQHFFAEIVRSDLSALNLLDSDFVMLNRSLAAHYGLDAALNNGFRKVSLPADNPRGGVLGQASILLRNSNGEDSHPILRGAWIKDRLLGDPPASPPPDVPELEKENPDFAKLSLKQQLEVHSERASCNNCHKKIDPWGVPLEHFDATGQWRTERKVLAPRKNGPGLRLTVSDTPIDADSVLANGQEIRGVEGLKEYLLKQEKDKFANALVRRLFAYALGRDLEFSDDQAVAELTQAFAKSDYQIDELIVAITKTKAFRHK